MNLKSKTKPQPMRGSGEAVESEAAGMEKRLWGRGRRHPETRGSAFSFPDDSGDCFVVFLVFQTLK